MMERFSPTIAGIIKGESLILEFFVRSKIAYMCLQICFSYRQIGKMLNAREPKIINGPQILDKYVGESEANIRKLFAEAEEEEKRVKIITKYSQPDTKIKYSPIFLL